MSRINSTPINDGNIQCEHNEWIWLQMEALGYIDQGEV